MMVNTEYADFPTPELNLFDELEPIRLLIDTDPGIDDVMAILLALSCPQADLVSITLTHGNTTLENCSRNISSLFHILDLQASVNPFKVHSIPRVAIGSKIPLKGNFIDAEDFHGRDGLGNISVTKPHFCDPHWAVDSFGGKTSQPKGFVYSELDSVDEILFQIKSSPPFSLVVVAIGPLTNIAKAWQKDPFTMGLIKRLVVMGGSINFPGNITPLSEFNFYADPYAANIVFNATCENIFEQESSIQNVDKPLPLKLTLVPLNITHTTYLHREILESHLNSLLSQPLADFFSSMLVASFKFTLEVDNVDGIALHDPLAVAIALGLVKPQTQLQSIQIEHTSSLTYGMCVYDARYNPPKPITDSDPCIEVCYTIPNPTSFQHMLLNYIFPGKK